MGRSVHVLLLLALPCLCAGAEGLQSIPRNPQPVAIDGEIDVLEWSAGAAQPLPSEIDPQRVVPTAWQTTVRMTHDGRNLLLAFDAQDDTPDRIVAARGARDTISNEDYVVVQIDAEGSRQRHYEFRVSAAGVLDDRIVGGSSAGSPQWSGAWLAAARRSDQGYVVEMSIPLSTLNVRMAADGSLALPMNVTRHIGRDRRETVSLLPVDTTQLCQECQYALFSLPGVQGEKQGLQLRPYLAVRQASQYPDAAAATSDTSIDPGIDVLWRLGGGRKVVATV
ncbi:MAG TPA: sugar-binding protein, partial [Steroidobacteraceae bacterium]|nr:sugar-binding protein [Steroidobacteraceae bacterium]